jgi:hypothetical protein
MLVYKMKRSSKSRSRSRSLITKSKKSENISIQVMKKGEKVCLKDVDFENMTGTLDNIPLFGRKYKLGDRVKFKTVPWEKSFYYEINKKV